MRVATPSFLSNVNIMIGEAQPLVIENIRVPGAWKRWAECRFA